MKSKLLLGLLFLLSIQAFSQEKKWSVEANYPLILGDDYPFGYDGLADLGIKYRIKSFGLFNIGAGVNTGLLVRHSRSFEDLKGRLFYIQPTVFTEMNLNKFHPFVGLGYSFWNENVTGKLDAQNEVDFHESLGGLNVNVGLSYDITKSIFVKAQYDYTRLRANDTFNLEGQNVDFKRKENVGFLKFGVGIRF